MGLDQYLWAQKNDNVEEIGYWRKHANLQGYMQNLAVQKGVVNTIDDFNMVDLPLTKEDIESVIRTIVDEQLPHTVGFFYGESYCDESEKQQDLVAFDDALGYAQDGWTVIYRCWW